MLGLIIKDFLQLKRILKAILFIYIIYIAISLLEQSSEMLVALSAISCTIASINSLVMDENSKWNQFALTLPFDRTKLVYSKYMILIIMAVISSFLPFGVSWYMTGNFSTALAFGGISILCGILCGALVMPFIFKFGAEKGRIFLMAIIWIPILSIALLREFGFDISMDALTELLAPLEQAPWLLIVGIVIFVLGSMMVSVCICRKKEY